MKKSIKELKSYQNVVERQRKAFMYRMDILKMKYDTLGTIIQQLESLLSDTLERIEENDDIWEQDAAALYFAIERLKIMDAVGRHFEDTSRFGG